MINTLNPQPYTRRDRLCISIPIRAIQSDPMISQLMSHTAFRETKFSLKFALKLDACSQRECHTLFFCFFPFFLFRWFLVFLYCFSVCEWVFWVRYWSVTVTQCRCTPVKSGISRADKWYLLISFKFSYHSPASDSTSIRWEILLN